MKVRRDAQIVLAKAVQKGAPGTFTASKFAAGQTVLVMLIHYPGQPPLPGSIGDIAGSVNKEWNFWTSLDIDYAKIFVEDDVNTLTCWRDQLPDKLPAASFKIKFYDELPEHQPINGVAFHYEGGEKGRPETCVWVYEGKEYRLPYKVVLEFSTAKGFPDAVQSQLDHWLKMLHNPD